jgi:hypothetical protein
MPRRPAKVDTLPPYVVVRRQLHAGDCGIASLAMLLGMPYETVYQHCPTAGRDGLTTSQLQWVARACGARLATRRRFDVTDDTGILGIEYRSKRYHGHWCLLREGHIYDPGDASVWDDPDAYLASEDATPDVLLSLVQHGPRSRGHQARRRR